MGRRVQAGGGGEVCVGVYNKAAIQTVSKTKYNGNSSGEAVHDVESVRYRSLHGLELVHRELIKSKRVLPALHAEQVSNLVLEERRGRTYAR